MMQAMMAPDMLKTSHSDNQNQELMIKEAVSEMALNPAAITWSSSDSSKQTTVHYQKK
jgi:hypothetical protein